jgi:hypothetical protein
MEFSMPFPSKTGPANIQKEAVFLRPETSGRGESSSGDASSISIVGRHWHAELGTSQDKQSQKRRLARIWSKALLHQSVSDVASDCKSCSCGEYSLANGTSWIMMDNLSEQKQPFRPL